MAEENSEVLMKLVIDAKAIGRKEAFAEMAAAMAEPVAPHLFACGLVVEGAKELALIEWHTQPMIRARFSSQAMYIAERVHQVTGRVIPGFVASNTNTFLVQA